jgi:hypothetical protein
LAQTSERQLLSKKSRTTERKSREKLEQKRSPKITRDSSFFYGWLPPLLTMIFAFKVDAPSYYYL